jgi:hypothetical protein
MNTLRRRWANGRVSLETPVIELVHRDGRRGRLVLTAHLGEREYFDELGGLLECESSVFYEVVRSVDDSPEHWREPRHRFLRDLREVYASLSALGLLAFQGEALAPRSAWVNADVTCCELADQLRARGVSVWRQEMALKALRQLVSRAAAGDPRAGKAIVVALQCGLLAASVTALFNLMSWLPTTRGLYQVLNDWRSDHAVRTVLGSGLDDFALIYGAAHGETLLRGFRRAGYRETGRTWHRVFTL